MSAYKFKFTVSKAEIDAANAIGEAMGRMPYSAIDPEKFIRAQARMMEYLARPSIPSWPLFAGFDRSASPERLSGATLDQQRRQARARLDKLGILKHGPMQSGYAGPCDPDCRKCTAEAAASAPPDPLDAVIDGVTLGELVRVNLLAECDNAAAMSKRGGFTTAQRAAVSAHWSAELRAKVAAAKERDRNEVRVDLQDEP